MLTERWQCNRQLIRSCPVVPIEKNYDRLGYASDGAARDERYTRYVSDQLILRTQTSCAVPDLLSGLNVDPPKDLLMILPGLVYRRDSIDRLHCGEPHQLDLWRIVDRQSGALMNFKKLDEMIAIVMQAALPAIRRDLSLCIEKSLNEEGIGDILRSQLLEVECIESLSIVSETAYSGLPPAAHERMGMQSSQKNTLLQLIIRHIDKTLTDKDANSVRNKVYKLLHEGGNAELADDG